MSLIRTINVLTFALILVLAGCFGAGDNASADDDDDEPNTAPVILATLESDLVCEGEDCNVQIYHAGVDPDGDLMEMGWDYDLDGNIDHMLIELKGMNNVTIPRVNALEYLISEETGTTYSTCENSQRIVTTTITEVSKLRMTIALLAIDENDAATGKLIDMNHHKYKVIL